MLLPSEYHALKRIRNGQKISQSELDRLKHLGHVTAPYIPADPDTLPPPYNPALTEKGERAMEDYRVNWQRANMLSIIALIISVLSLICSFLKIFN